MQQKLKSLLRKSSFRKKDDQPQHAKHDSGTATSGGRLSSTSSRIRHRVSNAMSNEEPKYRNSSDVPSPRGSYHRPLSLGNDPSVTATDYGTPKSEDIDNSIAENYKAYLPALASGGDVSRDSRYVSLGGDSRYITGASELKHSEDIADRNIDMYGTSSRHGSLPSQRDMHMFQAPIGELP
jgi:hypothetical protein